MRFTKELSQEQLKQIIYMECNKKNIAMTDNEELLDEILVILSKYIIDFGKNTPDLMETINNIDLWISNVYSHNPNFFIKGYNGGQPQ